MRDVKRAGSNPGQRCLHCGSPVHSGSRFCASCGHSLIAPTASAQVTAPFALTERRHLTVVFFDLVESAALATSLDPEDVAQIIRAFHQCLTEVVTRFGGFVAQYMGDGVLVYFGYPKAREDDAERAVAGALAAVEAIAALTTLGRTLQVRIGIAMGVAVVGDLARMGGTQGPELSGEAPNLAARLQGVAAPNTIAVADEVERLLGNLFHWRDLGFHRLKGWKEPIQVWQVLRIVRVANRFKVRQIQSAPFVGRSHEVAQLHDAWRAACAGSGQFVLVRGEAGLGKSRLITQFKQALGDEPHVRMHYFCSPHQQETSLYPCIQQIEHAAGFQPDDNLESKRAKLQALCSTMPEQDFALLAELLQITPTMLTQPFQPLSPHKRRQRTLEVLLGQLIRISRKAPILLLMEDAHWSDSSSTELLDMVARRISDLPILVIVTARPEFQPSWMRRSYIRRIDLSPLRLDESKEIVRWIACSEVLPSLVLDRILARSDGVPLYLEELTKTVMESVLQTERSTAWLQHSGTAAVPSSLHASLLARLDRLRDGREIAEVASAIGRDFELGVLGRVTGRSTRMLRATVARLITAGLVIPFGALNAERYRFKHALLQDAAYGMIIRARRQDLHARIAHVLEERLERGATPTPQLLAHHFTEAGIADKAVFWWLRAGLYSLRQSAVSEAQVQFKRGLDIVVSLPNNEWRANHELDLQIGFAKALIANIGWAAEQTGKALTAARELCGRLEAPPQLLSVLFGQWTHTFMRAELTEAHKQAEEILLEGERRNDPVWIVMGSYGLGYTAHALGRFQPAYENLSRGIASFDPDRRDSYAGPVVGDPRVMMRCFAAWTLRCLGRFGESRQTLAMALSDAREVDRVIALPHALLQSAYHTMHEALYETALETLNALQRIVDEHGLVYYGSVAAVYKGWCLAMSGEASEGLGTIRQGLAAYRAAGSKLYVPGLLSMEAEALGRDGTAEEGLIRIDEATRLAELTGENWDDSNIERIRGDLLQTCGARQAAEAAYRRAKRLARSRDALWFELRADIALARLLDDEGRALEAATVLTATLERFDPAEVSWDLSEAKMILASLSRATAYPRSVEGTF